MSVFSKLFNKYTFSKYLFTILLLFAYIVFGRYGAILFVISAVLSPLYYAKFKPYFIKADSNQFQIKLPYEFKSKSPNKQLGDYKWKYYQTPSRVGVILHESTLCQTYKMLEMDNFFIKSDWNYPSIIKYSPYPLSNDDKLLDQLGVINWKDLENNINGSGAAQLASSMHKYGFGIIRLDEDIEAYFIKNLLHFGFTYFQEPQTINKYKNAKGFRYWSENGNREVIQFQCRHKNHKNKNLKQTLMQAEGCKLYDAFHDICTTVNNILINQAQISQCLKFDIQKMMKQMNGENFSFRKKCRERSLLRVLYYPLLNMYPYSKLATWYNNLKEFITSLCGRSTNENYKYKNDQFEEMKEEMERKIVYLTHCDLGLVSLGAHSTNSGLQVLPSGHTKWIDIYDLLTDNDIIIYCGYTMSCLTNGYYQPLLHRVNMNLNQNKLKPRLAMPYFYRLPDYIKIPLMKENGLSIDKWIYVGELVGNIQRNRLLRRLKTNYVRWLFGFMSQIIVSFYPTKQTNFFDSVRKWV